MALFPSGRWRPWGHLGGDIRGDRPVGGNAGAFIAAQKPLWWPYWGARPSRALDQIRGVVLAGPGSSWAGTGPLLVGTG
jgi:hypothetical protein